MTTRQTAVRKLREGLGMNQAPFWARVGVTQSGGSRYESGRKIPRPTMMCLAIAYGSERERTAAIRGLRGS